MKRTGLLHPALSRAVASMGHGDALVVCDAGLPVPDGPERIDLALCRGVPSFLQVLDAIAQELRIERALIAAEFRTGGTGLHAGFVEAMRRIGDAQGGDIPVDRVSHEDFKLATRSAKALVRTGECTPYANVVLYSGVTF